MKVLSIRRPSRRKWLIRVENRFLFWKTRTTYGGTFDSYGYDIEWRDLDRNVPVNAIISAWLRKQVNDYLESRKKDKIGG